MRKITKGKKKEIIKLSDHIAEAAKLKQREQKFVVVETRNSGKWKVTARMANLKT